MLAGARASGLLALLPLASCAAPPPPPALPMPAAAPIELEAPGDPAGARWCYHPADPGRILGGLPLDTGAWLLVGERGERWLTGPVPAVPGGDSKDRPPLRAQASPFRAPEPLAAVIRAERDRWLAAGQSGMLYATESPLGPFVAATRPPEPLVKVAGAGSRLVGLTAAGGVLRFDAGGWRGAGAAAGERFFDVAAAGSGALLGLCFPEALRVSADGGESWTPLAGASSFGVQRLLPAAQGGVLVEGIDRDMRWDAQGGLAPAGGVQRWRLPGERPGTLAPERGPRARALLEGRAALAGGRYYEAFREQDEGGQGDAEAVGDEERDAGPRPAAAWLLAAGPLGGPLEVKPLAGAEPCAEVRLGAVGDHVLFACLSGAEGDARRTAEIWRSRDGGTRFERVAEFGVAAADLVSVAVRRDGRALLGGLCAAARERDCDPRAPLVLAPGARVVQPSRAPDLVGAPAALVFSRGGERAYFLGRRAKDERAALFVSHDAGSSFAARALGVPRAQAGGEPDELELEGDPPAASLHPGDDGSVGIALRAEEPGYAVADRDGALETVARLPPRALAVSGSGRQVLALGPEPGQGRGPAQLAAWESSDAGASFAAVSVGPRLGLDELDEAMLWCTVEGCVLADLATRVGWGPTMDEPGLPSPAPEDEAEPEPALGAPFECVLDSAEPWTTIADVYAQPGSVVPSEAQAARSESAWSVLRFVAETGETEAVSATGLAEDSPAKIVRQRLLGPVADRRRAAYDVAPQMEGYAVARVALPAAPAPGGAPMGKIEIAWVNYLGGSTGRAELGGAGAFERGDVQPGPQPLYQSGLLSVSPGGIFVRPHGASAQMFFVDARGQAGPPLRYPEWPAVGGELAARGDAVMAGGVPLAVEMLSTPRSHIAAVGLVPIAQSADRVGFTTLCPGPAAGRAVDEARWSYRGADVVGVTCHATDLGAARAWAYFSPFRGDGSFGPPEILPTQADLGAQPRACSGADRARSARLLAPWVPGTRHPVLVRSMAENPVLITDFAVLHGTPAQPCVAAWTASELRSGSGQIRALLAGSLGRAWLFRPTPGAPRSLDWRRMSCRTNPAAAVPDAVWREQGTTRRQR
ncbi:MAG: hypothetical protein HY744_25140 [Deltaproteobacteria bacterium]|nr:hypothetical protein [Deltaproteobacteria bacterium]